MNRLNVLLDKLENKKHEPLKSEIMFNEFKNAQEALMRKFKSLDKTVERLNTEQMNNLNFKK